MKIVLDGRKMRDKAATHAYLKEQLRLPEYYGNNLDALYDCLTELTEKPEIQIEHMEEMKQSLGEYAVALLETIQDAIS